VKYLDTLEQAVAAIHLAGVVHGDLYVSNVMWREKDGAVQIKIIDWDTAFLKDTGVPMTWEEMWLNKPKWLAYKLANNDPLQLDLFMVRALRFAFEKDELWTSLHTDDVSELNSRFKVVQKEYSNTFDLDGVDELLASGV
jgi:hypothetical protein